MSIPRRHAGRAVVLAVLLAGGCSWFGGDEKEKLVGTRVSVIALQEKLVAEPQSQPVTLPEARRNADWLQAGGNPQHNMQHLQAPEAGGNPAWRANTGEATEDSKPLLGAPIVAMGRVFTMDTGHHVRAFDLGSGERLWSNDLAEKSDDDDALAGGIAYEQGRIFATTGFGDIVALDAAGGTEIWRQSIAVPIHGPPAVDSGRIFAISIDNVLHARSAINGSELWPPHRAIIEPAALLGGANAAVAGGILVAPFTSGEIVALRVDDGRQLWSDSLGTSRRTDELAQLADIHARPVIDGGKVFALSYSGLLAAIDLRSGQRIWDREIGGIDQPWVAGGFLFVINNDSQLLCLSADNGSIVWVTQLQVFKNERKLTDPIVWSGPVLAGDRLIALGSHGEAVVASPYTGQILKTFRLPSGVSVAPIIADGTLFILGDDASLFAYR